MNHTKRVIAAFALAGAALAVTGTAQAQEADPTPVGNVTQVGQETDGSLEGSRGGQSELDRLRQRADEARQHGQRSFDDIQDEMDDRR